MSICYIIGALGTTTDFSPSENDFIIAADAGYRCLEQLGVKADLVVGDFDSLGSIPQGEQVIRYPVMKDDTDTMISVKLGLERGFDVFYIYGGLGGERTDHTIANIQTLAYIANNGGEGYLIGDNENITVIKNAEIVFSNKTRGTISIFALGGTALGVTLEGLLYPLENATLTSDFPIGVSNEFTGIPARIKVNNGYLLVIWSGEFDKPVKA